MAFDFITSPMSIFTKTGANRDIGVLGTGSNMEISRLSLQYSSANLSEEESSSLINILDRKRYHEKLAATRSADEQIQPSFFEKISTGSNTDSDLRVVRFDGGIAKEREMIDPTDDIDEED